MLKRMLKINFWTSKNTFLTKKVFLLFYIAVLAPFRG